MVIVLTWKSSIGFLYKVVHKIGRLRKFNRSREIEFNFLTAWTKGKGKGISYLTSVAKQAKTAFLHGPTV